MGQPEKKSRKKMWWILGAIIAVIVIIAAVVGGVVGSRSSRSSSNKDSSSSNNGDGDGSSGGSSGNGTSSSNTTEPLKNIRPNAKLAVTGYRIDDGFRIRLFFQGPEGNLRYSDYLSVNDAWSNPIELDNLKAINDTPVASSTLLDEDPPQVYLFYSDRNNELKGQIFQDGTRPVKGDAAGINSFPLTIDVSSRMASYFPYVVSQDANTGTIRWIEWHGFNDWSNSTFDGVKGTAGTGLALIPAAVKYLDGGAFVYRNEEGKMSIFLASQDGDVPSTWAWSYGAELAAAIPKESAIGAFVYGREADLINTYTLYQDRSGTLQVIWQNDTSSGWQGPKTYDALAGADNGTDITCVTQTAWDEQGVNISSTTDMNRCYFQSEGKVKEVRFDGLNWLDLGFLPIT
ncbi:hypothetical protein UCRPA7_4200 [Phaeoacremonium minimum UCRPA7]|uniref:Fucose-specific lectin n=1 Tax=Phaeoacremonium minimum (strain UCR-PA7) TaxID=1286976 RepID=R8BLX2_PHAM7|nr:hypothetical protein UCRPA7_4200 [Phaeoacremonium minimum UCRPA7]EOO00285.1 hypothetical protein UCRPA7_4200 [Phaeoacremonium minimum UCRPA7]